MFNKSSDLVRTEKTYNLHAGAAATHLLFPICELVYVHN